MLWEHMIGEKDEEFVTFEFPTRDLGGVAQIQRVHPPTLPIFHGLENEDPDEFLFKLEILYRTYFYFNWKCSIEHIMFKV